MQLNLEQKRQLNFLAAYPAGHTTMKHDDLQAVLLLTGGRMLACGSLYDIKATPLGVDVYRVELELTYKG